MGTQDPKPFFTKFVDESNLDAIHDVCGMKFGKFELLGLIVGPFALAGCNGQSNGFPKGSNKEKCACYSLHEFRK